MLFQISTDERIKRRDIDTLKRFLRPKLDDYGVAIKDVRAGNRFYRGVRWQECPQTVKQLGCPPAQNASLGRANRPGCRMFYASLAGPAVPFELKAKPGDRIALSEWELHEPLWMHNLGYHEAALNRLGQGRIVVRPQLSNLIPNESTANKCMRRLRPR